MIITFMGCREESILSASDGRAVLITREAFEKTG
jgi:hypothetical protein